MKKVLVVSVMLLAGTLCMHNTRKSQTYKTTNYQQAFFEKEENQPLSGQKPAGKYKMGKQYQ